MILTFSISSLLKMKPWFYIFGLLVIAASFSNPLLAQQPIIASISTDSGPSNSLVGISGSGFSTDMTKLVVRFGSVSATILSSTDNFIEVEAPSGAITSSISVTHLTSGLTGYSSGQFFIDFNGESSGVIGGDNFPYPATEELLDLVICDFDQDGKNDIAVTKPTNLVATDISIYHNISVTTTTIIFNELDGVSNAELKINQPTSNLSTGDIDGDGKPDLVASRAGDTRNQIFVWRNTSTVGNISFATAKSYFLSTAHLSKRVVVRDLDLDGKAEVAVTNTFNNEISIFENNSTIGNINLNFTPVVIAVGDAPSTNGIMAEDLDGDGKPELIVTPFLANNIYVLKNSSGAGNLSFEAAIKIDLTGNLNNLEVGDIDGDGKNDIAVTMTQQDQIAIVRNTSSTSLQFATPQTFPSNTSPWGIEFTDYLGNGVLEILVTSTMGSDFSVFTNQSTPGTISLTNNNFPQTNKSRNIASGDLSSDGKPDIAVTAFNTTTFELTILRNNICFQPEILGDISRTVCTPQTVRIEAIASPGATFDWFKDAVLEKSGIENFLDVTAPGVFTVTAITDGGACSLTSTNAITFTLNASAPPADPTASNDGPVCIGSTVTLTTPAIGDTYEWTGPDGFLSTNQNPVIANMTAVKAGFYSVVVTTSGCNSNPGQTLVEVLTPPDFSIFTSDPTKFCTGGSAALEVNSIAGYTYQWQLNSTDITGATSPTYVATTVGDYSVNISSLVNSCNITTGVVAITTFPPPTVTYATSGQLCVGTDITFSDTSNLEPGETPTYMWDFDDGTTATVANPVHAFSSAGTYIVSLTFGYVGQTCTNSSVQTITISDPSSFTINVIGNNPFCEGDNITLEVPGSFNSYSWSSGETTSTITVTTAGDYSVSATNAAGCVSTDLITVSSVPLPTIVASAVSETIILGDTAQLSASGASTYSWTPVETLDDPTLPNPRATPQATTTYTVVGTDALGCMGTDMITIQVEDSGSKLPVSAPRMFSPNGDTIDDFWVIQNILLFPNCKLKIFTRNGKTVHEAEPYLNDWDGRDMAGADLPEGPYFYIISCDDGKSATGSVSIIR